MVMKVFIYTLLDPITKEVRYVGKTLNPSQRFRKHLIRKENNHKHSWVKSLIDKGIKPEMVIIERLTVETDREWQLVERWWIQRLKDAGCRLTNLNDGGIGGIRPCEETRKKMSDAHKGKSPSEEARAKISAYHTGRPKSEETRKKFSQRMIGWNPSCGTRQKMAENARRGMTPDRIKKLKAASKTPESLDKMSTSLREFWKTDEGREINLMRAKKISKPVAQFSTDGEVIEFFESVISASKATNLNPSHIASCARGRKGFKTAGGFKWQFRTNPKPMKELRDLCGFGATEPEVHWP